MTNFIIVRVYYRNGGHIDNVQIKDSSSLCEAICI